MGPTQRQFLSIEPIQLTMFAGRTNARLAETPSLFNVSMVFSSTPELGKASESFVII